MPLDLVEFPQRLGVPLSGMDAVVVASVAGFLVCLVVAAIDVIYLSVSSQRDQNDPRNVR